MAIRRPSRPNSSQKDGPRANEDIDSTEVQVIDTEGINHGAVPLAQAIEMAAEEGMDLVEVSPNAKPPVCKMLDLGKYKYQAQKKAAEARKKQRTVDVKEIKLRPNIDTNDYDVKMRNLRRFIDQGDKVKVTIRFRGREFAHQQLGMDLLKRIKGEMIDFAKIEAEPKLEGRQMIMIIAPN